MLEPKYGCKQVKARSGWWCVIAGSHPVDGWPCDNLTHQPPSPLCVQLHKRINKRSRINSRPVASKTEQGGSRTAQNAAVSVIAVCHCLYIYIMLCRPDFNNLQLEGRVFFSLNCPIMFLHYSLVGWNMDMSPWQSPYLVFVYMLSCAKHSHHPALQPSIDYPGHAPHHGHLDIQYTMKI